MKKKSRLMLLVSFIFMVCLSGCAKWQSVINDLHGSLIGNSYSIYTYDNYGSQTLKTSGNKISITVVLCQEKVQIKYNQFSLFM